MSFPCFHVFVLPRNLFGSGSAGLGDSKMKNRAWMGLPLYVALVFAIASGGCQKEKKTSPAGPQAASQTQAGKATGATSRDTASEAQQQAPVNNDPTFENLCDLYVQAEKAEYGANTNAKFLETDRVNCLGQKDFYPEATNKAELEKVFVEYLLSRCNGKASEEFIKCYNDNFKGALDARDAKFKEQQ
jgi:hypothetical protein